MLNAILTVRAGKSDSHKDLGWLDFTKHVLNVINKDKKGTIFMVWGKKAEKIADKINKSDHHYLYFGHPSPLSEGTKFANCDHFSNANQYLLDRGQAAIDWQI